jgi:hypothetical protein
MDGWMDVVCRLVDGQEGEGGEYVLKLDEI